MDLRRALPIALLASLTFLVLTRPQDEHGQASPSLVEAFPQSPGVLPPESTPAPAPEAFQDLAKVTELRDGLSEGLPIKLSLGDHDHQRFLFRPRKALANNFAVRLGTTGNLDASPQVFEGLPLDSRNAGSIASLVLTGNALAAVVRHQDGETTYVRTHPITGEWEAQTEGAESLQTLCQADPLTGTYHLASDDPLADGEAFWEGAIAAQLAPDTAALTGIDPATNRLDKYIDPIARATRYDASLRDALLLLVLDKEATGSNDISNLTSKASLYLATVSNVAAAYENQLGVRLLVQEMIMIPDTGDFVDIPADDDDAISDFRTWMQRNRLNSTYRWTVAMKFGTGLTGTTLGIAFVGATRNNSAVGVCRTSARWDVLAHEMGHNFGSNHTSGGLMNASTTNNNNRSFFTDVSTSETAAKDIYDYTRLRLLGPAIMRHPEEIPFANRDNESTPLNTPVSLSPLDNDDNQVRNGQVNSLALEEVSGVTPLGAGSVEILGNDVRFIPTADFQGTAWFSYSLRGSVGNANKGWLHKGDVAIEVGATPNNTLISLAPGASYSFFPSAGTSGTTQPSQALVSRSRDDTALLIIRVNADASGSETFRAGGRTYTLEYTAASPRVTNDRFIYDSAEGSLVFNPLLNDEGAGEAWVNPIKPTIGVGTLDHDTSGDELFPTTFRLVSATNRTPEKGSLSTRTLTFIVGGQRTNVLDSTLSFAARSGSSGTAIIDYVVEDATGSQATGVVEIILPFRIDTLVNEGATARYIVPSDATADAEWMLSEFDDSTWSSGPTGLGYDTNTDFLSSVSTTLTGFQGTNTSVFVRLPFTANSVAQYTQLALRMKIDDGFVAYLNGQEVARSSNILGATPLAWNTEANESTNDSQALTFATFDLTANTSLLRDGTNVLAIHGMNATLDSSDFLLVPELEASVTASGLLLTSPTAPDIQLPVGSSLALRTESTGAVAGGSTTWQVFAGEPSAVAIDPVSADESTILINSVGNYVLEATTSIGGLTETTQLSISAIATATADSAAAVDAGASLSLSEFTTALAATASPSELEKVQWSQVSGPSDSIFSSPNTLETVVAFPQAGSYELRVAVTRKGIETFDTVTISTTPLQNALAALTKPVTSTEPTSATLNLVSLFTEGPVSATLFLGTTDSQTTASDWDRTIPVGTVSSGSFELSVADLLFQTVYVYRLQLQRGQTTVWSEPGSFETLVSPLIATDLVDANSPATVLIPLDDTLGDVWTSQDFDDAAWTSGSAGVGFDLDTDFDDFIVTDVEEEMYENSTSVYTRVSFDLTDIATVETLTLKMRYDDAFVAYLNGIEITRSATAPQNEALNASSAAAILREDIEAVEQEAYDLSEHISLLRRGENVLAIHGLNFIAANRDLLISPQLSVERRRTYYQDWLEGFSFTESAQALEADPDGDGLNNLMEYAFGTDPSLSETNNANKLTLSQDLALTYTRRADSAARGILFNLEQSTDLRTWNEVDDVAEVVTASDTRQQVQFQTPDQANAALGFWRLRVSVE